MNRHWGADKDFIVEALAVDGTKASTARNYRVAHHTISVFFGVMWGEIATMYNSEHGAGMEVTNAGAKASHGRGRSAATSGRGRASGATKALAAAVTSSRSGETRREGDGSEIRSGTGSYQSHLWQRRSRWPHGGRVNAFSRHLN